ncbi:MarR family transcriptional regulator [Streptomyces sp. So13.3]|uniref:MarR family winged helix-turn-helix transcriptional regulator n=1 Tax=Streptomyces TaxID=1883 RepID=UPI0011063074|nr:MULTISPECIES: MarR family transcriptional regulator [unclassified Streptomyces]MCZ4098709.1 MarR family transcriptional regulator [Streptomyces sp. H39-C1]QNA76271.1 MarR family transcriptional regulator [Streptomyces sp. So13.3]
MPSNAPHPETLELAADLRAALGNLVRFLRHGDELPQSQAAALGLLVRDERSYTVAELAELQRVRHQSMARTVALMARAGLVTQQPHPTDGRKLLVTVAEAGRTALLDQRARRERLIASTIESRLNPAEQHQLRAAIDLLERLS